MASTASQQVALALIPKFSGTLSILGSSWIVVEVITRKSKRENVYNRLLCAMSAADVIASVTFLLSTWPIPWWEQGLAFNVGNQNTCTAQGFFIQWSIACPLYNMCLALYFMLVVKFGVSEDRLRSTYELPLHLVPILFGVGTAIAGIFLNLYNNASLWCWIAPWPSDCEDSISHGGETTCERGDNAWVYRWAFFFAPLWFCFFLAVTSMGVLYATVRRREREAMKAIAKVEDTRGQHREGGPSIIVNSPECPKISGPTQQLRQSSFMMSRKDLMQKEGGVMMPKRMANEVQRRWESSRHLSSNRGPAKQAFRISPTGKVVSLSRGDSGRSKASSGRDSVGETAKTPSFSNANSSEVGSSHSQSNVSRSRILQVINSYACAAHQNVEANHSGGRAVFRQSILYTAVFILTWAFATANRVYQQLSGGSSLFGFLLLHSLFVPMQGLLNVLVYRSMNFYRLRQRNPDMPTWTVIRLTFRWSFLGPPSWASGEDKAKAEGAGLAKTNKGIGNNSEEQLDESAKQISSALAEPQFSGGVAHSAETPASSESSALSPNATPAESLPADPIWDFDFVESPMDDEAGMYGMLADIDLSYSEFPDLLTEDTVMVATHFPTVVCEPIPE